MAFAEIAIPDDDPLLDFIPYCHEARRGHSITPPVQRAFIYQLAETGIVTAAAINVGKSIQALYKLRARPGAEGFAKAWDAALEWGRLRLEDCAMERTIHQGVHNPRANSMICWVIQHRSHHMVDARTVIPGNWLYKSIRYDLTGAWGDEDEDGEDDNSSNLA